MDKFTTTNIVTCLSVTKAFYHGQPHENPALNVEHHQNNCRKQNRHLNFDIVSFYRKLFTPSFKIHALSKLKFATFWGKQLKFSFKYVREVLTAL